MGLITNLLRRRLPRFDRWYEREVLGQCPVVLSGPSMGSYCQKTRLHDGPHETFEGKVFFVWRDGAGNKMIAVLKLERVGYERGEFLAVEGFSEDMATHAVQKTRPVCIGD